MAETNNLILETDLSKQIPESQIITLDVIGPEEILDNRRIPDTLPKGSFQKLPETFESVCSAPDRRCQVCGHRAGPYWCGPKARCSGMCFVCCAAPLLAQLAAAGKTFG